MRILHDLENQILEDDVVDAYSYFDGRSGWLRRAVLPQRWRWYRDHLGPSHEAVSFGRHHRDVRDHRMIEVPIAALISVEEIAVTDDHGGWTILDPGSYLVVPATFYGQILPTPRAVWPTFTPGPRAVRILFTAGYAAVPPGIKRAVKLLAGSFYNNREATLEDARMRATSRKLEYGLEVLAGHYRVPNDMVPKC